MKRPAFEVVEHKTTTSQYPILLIDKKGLVGTLLAKELQSHGAIVFVSAHDPVQTEKSLTDEVLTKQMLENLIYIPHHGRIPQIPDNAYGEIFLIAENRDEVIEFLPGLTIKAGETKSHVVVVVHLSLRGKEFEETLLSHKNVRIVYYGDIFGEEIFLSHSDVVNTFLRQALAGGRMEVPQSGMEKTFPVYYKDVILGVLEAAYGAHSSRVYFLFPEHSPTQLMVARMLQKTEPLLRTDFTGQDFAGISVKEHKLHIGGGIYLLEKHYPLEKKLQKTFKALLSSFSFARKNTPTLGKDVWAKHLSSQKNQSPGISWGFLLLSIVMGVVFIPFVLFFLAAGIGAKELISAKYTLERGDIGGAHRSAQVAEIAFAASHIPKPLIEAEVGLVGQRESFAPFVKATILGKDVATFIMAAAEGLASYKTVLAGESSVPARDFAQGSESIKQAVTILAKIRAEDPKELPLLLQAPVGKLSTFDGISRLVMGTIDTYPDILGFLGERKYLVLFQNNMELRPGGGFIGSFGLLTVKDGKTKEFVLQDVYDADGQLKGHIEPPFALRRYLPVAHWYLRDSNFNIDYAKGASISAMLLEQEIGQRVDGVIGVDVTFLQKLLRVTGPLFISEYNETVTAENMYFLTQGHAEKDFFPGSTQKKDFLKSLSNALQIHFSAKGNSHPYPVLGKVTQEAIAQKHIVFAFSNPAVQNVFAVNGMSSSLKDTREKNTDEIVDMFGVSEANLGANKVNYFMRRKISQTATIDKEGNITEAVSLRYKNTSTKQDAFGGDYKTFLRIITPLGTKINSIVIDGQEQKMVPAVTDPKTYEAKNFRPPLGLEVETTEQESASVFGFLIVVPVDSFKTVIVTYVLPQKASLDTPSFSYSHRVFKQPGTENDAYTFSLVFPETIKAFSVPKEVEIKNGKITYTSSLLEDINFDLRFSKK